MTDNADMIRSAQRANARGTRLSDVEALRCIADNIEGFWLGMAERAQLGGGSPGLTRVAKEDAQRLRDIANKLGTL